MQSDYNHIDDFFRRKEKDSSAGNNQQDKHWQQMKDLLVVPGPPTVKIRTVNTRLYWQAAAGTIIVAVFAFLFFRKTNTVKTIAVKNSIEHQNHTATDSTPLQLNNQRLVIINPNKFISAEIIRVQKGKSIPDKKEKQKNLPDTLPEEQGDSNKKDSKTALFSNEPVSNQSIAESKKQLEQFFDQLRKPAQEFYVNTRKDTTIYCNEGTSIFIPANSFVTSLGLSVTTLVKVSVREFYNFADIISNKLSTTSNGELLITGGMLHIQAEAGKELLQIKQGTMLDLQMPAKSFDPQMQLFTSQSRSGFTATASKVTGDSVAFNSEGINWIPAGQQQLFYANKYKMITVLNLSNNPREIFYKHPYNPSKMKSVASFLIPWYCYATTTEIKKELENRYFRYYDEIRVKREHKPWSAKARRRDSSYTYAFYESPYVGDSVTIHISTATRLKYITHHDSLRYEAQWKKELEDAIKRNRSYSELMQMKEQYNFKLTNLGWINCDRFRNYSKESLSNVIVSSGDEFKEVNFHSILILNQENAVMQGYTDQGKIVFGRIPKGKSASLVCIGVKNGKVFTCIRNLVVGSQEIKDLEFTETNPEDFKAKLQRFGSIGRRG